MASARAKETLAYIFTCCLCFETYNTTVNIPKALPCLHTFCAPCLDKFICAVNENGEELQCPTCKAGFSVPKEGARKLPTNLSVQQMIELKMHQATPPQDGEGKPGVNLKHYTCKEHAGKQVMMVCVECEIELCTDCVKVLHKTKHNKHELEDTETYLLTCKQKIERLKKGSQKLPERHDQAKKAADTSLRNTKRERESEMDQQAECAIQQVRRWQITQRNAFNHSEEMHYMKTYLNNGDIKSFSSEIDQLDNCECNTLPSMKGIMDAMLELTKLETECTNLSKTEFEMPPIQPIKVVIGNQKK